MLHSSSAIEFYSILKKKKKKNYVSQIQDKSRFAVTVFGDSERIYDVGRGSSFLDSARFYRFFHNASYKVFVLKGRLFILENKIETEVVKNGRISSFSVVSIAERICVYMVPMILIIVQVFFYVCFAPKIVEVKVHVKIIRQKTKR